MLRPCNNIYAIGLRNERTDKTRLGRTWISEKRGKEEGKYVIDLTATSHACRDKARRSKLITQPETRFLAATNRREEIGLAI